MAKYLYFQDGHAKGKNSINRTGDYFSDWLLKFDELLFIAKENKVDAILDGGDLFDSPIVSYSVCDAIVDRIEKAELEYHCLFGNHSERYHSKEHSFDTTLAHVLRRSRNFKYLNKDKFGGDNSVIRGIEYKHNIEEEIKEEGIIFENKYKDCWKIAITHAFICPESFPYASHVVCNDIKTNADLVLVAHYHKAWQEKVGDTQYLDIGCFGRNSITEANIEPSCVLLDTQKRSWEVIKLTSAKRGQDVFDLKKIQELKNKEADIDVFIQSLESVSFQGQSIEGIIKNVAKEDNTKQEVVDLIVNKIAEVQNGL
jgi:DNA repair exonuclease SbcCD nuclease subunit